MYNSMTSFTGPALGPVFMGLHKENDGTRSYAFRRHRKEIAWFGRAFAQRTARDHSVGRSAASEALVMVPLVVEELDAAICWAFSKLAWARRSLPES